MSASVAKLEVIRGDITKLEVDAIVNAANSQLSPGGGVCGAIHQAAGPSLAKECRALGHCAPGDAVVTGAHDLRSVKWIIQAVGPIYDGTTKSAATLRSVYRAIIQRCSERGLHSVAIPCISTGIYGYPKIEAAKIAVSTVREQVASAKTLSHVIFCCFSSEDEEIYRSLLES